MTTTQYDSPEYDMQSSNLAYQVDYKNVASGKILSATKRRVSWRFGFSNGESMKEGLTASDCRGLEHEVTLTWSKASGKREVKADGQEVHFSIGKLSDVRCEASWQMRGGHLLKMVAYAAPPVLNQGVESRQYDLLIDEISFFDLPQIHNLGTITMQTTSQSNLPFDGLENHSTRSFSKKGRRSFTMNPFSRASSAPNINYENQTDATPTEPVRAFSVPEMNYESVSPQSNSQQFSDAKAFDNSGFFRAPSSPTNVQDFSTAQKPQIFHSNYGLYSQEKMITDNSSFVSTKSYPTSPNHYRNSDPTIFNMAQDNGMDFDAQQQSTIASKYSQNPGQRISRFFSSGIMHKK